MIKLIADWINARSNKETRRAEAHNQNVSDDDGLALQLLEAARINREAAAHAEGVANQVVKALLERNRQLQQDQHARNHL